MKIALCYAPSEQQFIPVPPLGISVLKSYLKQHEKDVTTFDLELELWLSQGYKSSEFAKKDNFIIDETKIKLDSIIEKLKSFEIICLSIMGKRQIPYSKMIIQNLRNEQRKFIVGGAFITEGNSFDVLDTIDADYAIIGEGWKPMLQLINEIEGKNYDYSCFNVNEKNGKVVIKNNLKEKVQIPEADYSDINLEGYIKQQKKLYKIDYNDINYQLLVGDRCCPYNCSFCRISKSTETIKDAIDISNEMISMHNAYGCKNFSLICNEMNPTKKFINEFTNNLISANLNLSWFCYLRPNNLSKLDLRRIKQAGCVLVRYGVESGSQKILDHMNKELYVDEMKQILKDSHEVGLWNHINIMTGYLHENDNDIQQTIDFINDNSDYIDSVRVNPFFVPIDSPIHKDPERFGISIIEDTGSYISFNEKINSWDEKVIQIQKSTDAILKECKKHNIGFAGILPNLVSTVIEYFNDKKLAKKWLEENHSYLWEPLSPDTAKWKLAHPETSDVVINPWEKISGQRGENYQTRI